MSFSLKSDETDLNRQFIILNYVKLSLLWCTRILKCQTGGEFVSVQSTNMWQCDISRFIRHQKIDETSKISACKLQLYKEEILGIARKRMGTKISIRMFWIRFSSVRCELRFKRQGIMEAKSDKTANDRLWLMVVLSKKVNSPTGRL